MRDSAVVQTAAWVRERIGHSQIGCWKYTRATHVMHRSQARANLTLSIACRCPDELSSSRHAFRHNGDDQNFCPLPNDELRLSTIPEPDWCRVLASEHAGSAFLGSEPLVMMPEEAGAREDCGEMEIDLSAGLDFGDGLLPPENFVFDDDLSGGLMSFDEVFDHGGTCSHKGTAPVLVQFDVKSASGEERGFDQPLRHTSSGAASRHRALPPMAALMTMRRSHSEVEIERVEIDQQFASTQSATMRRSHSDSMLAQNGRFHAILPAAVDVPAKRKRQR